MWSVPIYFFIVCFFTHNVIGTKRPEGQTDTGVPLQLTPLLEQGKVAEAQEQSRVRPDIGNMTSYSGYFTVNKNCESNLFFWYFPAQKNRDKAPLMLFLQGGPGASSIYSLFEDMGPLTHKGRLGRRQYSWNVENNLLFIDQPVGTGYSYTGKGCLAENETVVATELYSAMVQFYQLFPQLTNNKFIIAGYSYAGHFIPQLGYTIHKNNPTAKVKINLSGMMIGNGWMDAVYQNDLGSYLYQLGLVDDKGRDIYYDKQKQFDQYMKNKEYQKALELRGDLVSTTYVNLVGNVSILNYLERLVLEDFSYERFIKTPQIRKAIHVGNTTFLFINPQVEVSLGVAPVLSVKTMVEELLEHYPIVFYTGQLDIICAYPMVTSFLKALNWSGKTDFQNATRQKWCVGEVQAGYFTGAHNMYNVIVRNAGHSVPEDQPQWGYELANSITSGVPGNPVSKLTIC